MVDNHVRTVLASPNYVSASRFKATDYVSTIRYVMYGTDCMSTLILPRNLLLLNKK